MPQNTSSEMARSGFVGIFIDELFRTVGLYANVARRPQLLVLGMYAVCRDIFYELPTSLFRNVKQAGDRRGERSSQALALSELMTIPGTYAGLFVFAKLGAGKYVSTVIGGAVGNYLSGALSFLVFYIALAMGIKGYRMADSLVDAARVVKDCFPLSLALYITEAPLLSAMVAAGVSPILATGINIVAIMAIFTGLAKCSADRNLGIN